MRNKNNARRIACRYFRKTCEYGLRAFSLRMKTCAKLFDFCSINIIFLTCKITLFTWSILETLGQSRFVGTCHMCILLPVMHDPFRTMQLDIGLSGVLNFFLSGS